VSNVARGAIVVEYVFSQAIATVAAFYPPAIAIALVPPAIVWAIEGPDERDLPGPAYRGLPTFFLIPEKFESEAARDAFFAALRTKLESAAAAQRANLEARCNPWPCPHNGINPCPDWWCAEPRRRIDDELKAQLALLPLVQARTCIEPP
jgi:hypothetical protein